MQINEIQQSNDNQQMHSSKAILVMTRGSGGPDSFKVTQESYTPQLTVHHCFPDDIRLVCGLLDIEDHTTL